MKKLTALAVALLASTAAYAEPYQTNEQFRTNWNSLEEKAHLSRVEHSVLPPTADDPSSTNVWSFPLPGRNVTVVMFESRHSAMYCFDTGEPTTDCYDNHGEKNTVVNHRNTPAPEPVSSSSGELTCTSPVLTVGKQDPMAVTSLKISHSGSYWSIVYTMSDGTVYQRNEQYDIRDTSTENVQEWSGRKRTDSDVTEIGDLTQSGSTFTYNERLWHGSRLTLDATANCWSAAATIEANAPPAAEPSPPVVSQATPGVDTVPYIRSEGENLIDITIGGLPARMVIDTGATHTSITKALANQLLTSGQARIGQDGQATVADGRTNEIHSLVVRSMQIGPRTIYDVLVTYSDNDSPDALMLLGFSALSKAGAFTIDAANHRISFN